MSTVTRSIADNGLPALEIRPKEMHQPFPLTDLQNAYWIGRSAAFELGRVAAHAYFEFESKNGLDVERLTETWRRLIARHPMLRAIVRPDGQQEILEHVPPYEIQLLDLGSNDPQTAESEVLALRNRMSHRTNPTDQWPLFDVAATRLPGNRLRVHLSIDLLLVDFTSISILLKEWEALYLNPDAVLPEIDISFRDYVLANAAIEGSGPYEAARTYWQKKLPNLAPPPELPSAKTKANLAPRFVRYRGRLEADDWQRFKDHASDGSLTPSSALLAVFAIVIGIWSKHSRFTLDLTIFNRLPLHPHMNRLVGDFTSNTLLTVDQLSEGSFADFGARLQEQVFQDMEHRYFSGVRVLREWARFNKGSPRLLTPIVFTSAVGALGPGKEDSPWRWLGKMVYAVSQTPQVSLDHSLYPDGDALIFNWDVMEQLFPSGMVEEMFAVYEKLLRCLSTEEQLWQKPTRELLHLLLPQAQTEQRAAVNATAAPLPSGWLHTRFAQQASQRPQQTAVITPTRSLSYQELFQRANHLAHRLRRQGVAPNQLVAVAMEKGWEQVVAVLGILAAGAAYLPIDPTLPEERIVYLLQHGQAGIVLIQPQSQQQPWLASALCTIVVDEESLSQESSAWLEPVQQPSDLAYVIYTSGSTGLPKGVMISHDAALNTIVDVNQRIGLSEQDRVFGLSSLSFDLSVYDIFGTLAAGATLVLPRAGSMRDPEHWAEIMTTTQTTVWNSVPALLEMLVEYAQGRAVQVPLRVAMLSGDWIPVSLPGRLWQWLTGVELISMGGATEAAIWSILYPVKEVNPEWESIPYGKPMVNQRFYVLNEALESCPVWVPGQLYIGGVGLAQGYWRDGERTASSFFVHPGSGERLYRTGDLGRYLPDGNIEFLGREDFQVKVHGHRIELGEIEAALAQHPRVRTAVVTAQGKNKFHKRLVGYVVPTSGESAPDVGELREFISAKLPDYMVPADILLLADLPLSSNGKIDRRALPSPDALAQSELISSDTATLSETLKTIFASVLGIADAEVHTNFFEMGGDSIMAIQIINRAREHDIDITPQQIFEHQTIAALVAVVRTTKGAPQNGIVTGDAHLTPFQRWILESRSEPRQDAQVFLIQAPYHVDVALLDQAFLILQQHHDALRLRYHMQNGEWQQTHIGEDQLVHVTKLRREQIQDLDSAIDELCRHLDVSRNPLVLGYIEQDQPLLIWLIHELLVDQHSWKILLHDLQTVYSQLERGEKPKFNGKTTSFKQWAETTDSQVLPSLKEQANKALTAMPADYLDLDLSNLLLGQVLLIYNVTVSEVLIAALAKTIASHLSTSSLCLDIEADGRQQLSDGRDFERSVGCFTSLVSMTLNLKDTYDYDSALKSVKEKLRQKVFSNVESRVLFSYFDPLPQQAPQLEDFSEFEGKQPARIGLMFPHPLQLHCAIKQGRVEMNWIFDEREYRVSEIRRLSDVFRDNLHSLIRHCQSFEGTVYSPSDFPEAGVNQEELDKFLGLLGKSSGGG